MTIFTAPRSKTLVTLSIATLAGEETDRLIRAYSRPVVATWSAQSGGTSESRYSSAGRDPFLEALDQLAELKKTLRAKYGEFDVDGDLEELRAERLSGLG